MTSRLRLALSAALAVSFAAPFAYADTTTTTEAPAKVAKKVVDPRMDDNAVVCRRDDATGTRLGATKTCHTRAEWAARSASAREQMDRIQTTPQTH